jgi:hypothetical protein
MKCILAVIIALLSMVGNTIMLIGGIVIVVPAYIADLISGLSFRLRNWLSKTLQFEFPWWQPLGPGVIINAVLNYVKRKWNDFGKILDWAKQICK